MCNRILRIYTGIIFQLTVVNAVLADNCSSPGDCLQTAGYNAMVAIIGGGLGIVTALFGSQIAERIREELSHVFPNLPDTNVTDALVGEAEASSVIPVPMPPPVVKPPFLGSAITLEPPPEDPGGPSSGQPPTVSTETVKGVEKIYPADPESITYPEKAMPTTLEEKMQEEMERGRAKSKTEESFVREREAIQDQRGRVRHETVKHIKDITEEVLKDRGRKIVVTSEYRDNSTAHKRGAIDISSKDLSSEDRHEEARLLSEHLGKGYTVVVEEIILNEDQKKDHQVNTSYRKGKKLNRRILDEIKASATHTHIQSDS